VTVTCASKAAGGANGHGVSATAEDQYGTKSVAAAMTVSLTPALPQWARVTGSALRATFIVTLHLVVEQVLGFGLC